MSDGKKRGGWNNPAAATNGTKGGRPKAFATVRIPIDAAAPLLDYLNEQHHTMSREHPAERGMAFLVAGLWSEVAKQD